LARSFLHGWCKYLIKITAAIENANYFGPIAGDPIKYDMWPHDDRPKPAPNFVSRPSGERVIFQ
jgi:hypothetical protein